MSNAKVWYSVKDLAERWGKSAGAVERLIKKGDVLAKKIGGTWRVHVDALTTYESDGVPQPEKPWVPQFRASLPRRAGRASPRVEPGCAA